MYKLDKEGTDCLHAMLDFMSTQDGFLAFSHNAEEAKWSCTLVRGDAYSAQDTKVTSGKSYLLEDAVKEVMFKLKLGILGPSLRIV